MLGCLRSSELLQFIRSNDVIAEVAWGLIDA
jgi:hypothetical protein